MHWIRRWVVEDNGWIDRCKYTEIDVADTKRKHGSEILTFTYSRNIKNCTCTHKQMHMRTCTHCFQHNACSVVTCILWPTSYKWINITAFPGMSFVCVRSWFFHIVQRFSKTRSLSTGSEKAVRFRFIQIVIHASLGFMLILKQKGKKESVQMKQVRKEISNQCWGVTD